jgi:hypothetical protein
MSIRRDGRRSFRSQLRSAARHRLVGEEGEVDSGKRVGVPTDMAEKLKALERPRASPDERDLRKGVSVFCPGGALRA